MTSTADTRAGIAPPAELTIDQLAARTGLTVRTVRFYAAQGLLPAPERRGRIAYYDARHRMRLDLIRTLQEHGYTLAAIERVLSRLPVDAGPEQYAVQAAMLAPWLTDPREELDLTAIEHRIGKRLDADTVGFLIEVGALEPVDGADERYRTAPATLGMAVELLELPVPVSVLRASTSIIEQHATAVAQGLTDVFVEGIWGPYRRGEIDDEQVVAMLVRLRPLAVQGLTAAFVRAADRASRRT